MERSHHFVPPENSTAPTSEDLKTTPRHDSSARQFSAGSIAPSVLPGARAQEEKTEKKEQSYGATECDDKVHDEDDTNAFTFRVPKPQDHNYASYEHSFGINGPTRGQDWLWEPEMSDKDFGPPIEPFARPPHLRQRKIVSRFRERLHEDDHVSGVAGPAVGRGEDNGKDERNDSSTLSKVSTKSGLPKSQDDPDTSGRKVTPPRRKLQKKRPEDKSVASRKVSSSSSKRSDTPSNLVPGEGVPATPPIRPLTNSEANAAQLGIGTSPLNMIQRTAKKVAGFFGVIQESDTASTSVTDTSTDTDGDQRERAAQQFIQRSTLPHRVLPYEEPSDEPPKDLRDGAGLLDPAAERRIEERLVKGVDLAQATATERRKYRKTRESTNLTTYSHSEKVLDAAKRSPKASITTECLHEQAALLGERRRRSGSPTKQLRLDDENAEPARDLSRQESESSPALEGQVEQTQPPTVLSVAQQLRRDNSDSSRNTRSSRYSDEEPDTDESEGGRRGSPELGRATERSFSPELDDDEGDDLWSGTHAEDRSSSFWSRALGAFDDVYEMLLPTLDEDNMARDEEKVDSPVLACQSGDCEEWRADGDNALDDLYLGIRQEYEDLVVEESPVTVAVARLPDEPDPFPFLSNHLGLLAHQIHLPSCQHVGGPDHFHDLPPDMRSTHSELRSEQTEGTGWNDLSTETYHAILKMQASLPNYEEPLCVRLGVKLLFYSAEKRKSVLDDLADWGLHSTVKDLKMILDKGQAGLRSVLQEFYTREIEQRRSRQRQKSLEDYEAYRENADVPGGLRTRSRSATPNGDQRKRLPPAYPRIPSVSGLPPRTPSLLPSVPAIQLAPSSISFGTVEKIHTGISYDQPSSQAEKKAKLAAHFRQKAEELEDIESEDLSLRSLSFPSPLGSPETSPEVGDIVVDPVEEVGRKSEELLKQAKALQTDIRHGRGLIANLCGQKHRSDTTQGEVQAGPSVIHDRQSEEGCDSEHIENVSPTAAESEPLDKGAPQVQSTIDRRSETVVPAAPSASTDETGPKGRTPRDLQAPPSPPSSIDTTFTSSSERQRRLNHHLDGRRNSWTPGKTKSSASIGTSSGEAIHLQHTPSAAEHLLSVFAQPSATSPRKKRHRDSTVERLEAQAARAVVSNRLQHEASERVIAEAKLDERTKENTAVNAGRARRLSDVAAGLRKAADLPKERRNVELPPELQMTVARKPSEMSKREGKMPVRETTHKGTEGRRVSFSDPFDDGSMPDEKYGDLSKAMDLDVESGTSASEAVQELSDSLSRSPRYQQASLPPRANVVTEEVKDAPRKDSSRKTSDPHPESADCPETAVTDQCEPSIHDQVDVLDFGDQAHTDARSANDSEGATVVSNTSKSTPPISIPQTSAGNNPAAAPELDLNSQQLTPARPRAPRNSSFAEPNRTSLPPPLDLSSQLPTTTNAAGSVTALPTSPVSLITAELDKRRCEDRERREREELLRIDRERMERLAQSELKRPLSRERGVKMESVDGNQLSPTTPPPPPEHRIGARFEAKQMQQPDDDLPPVPPSPRLRDDPHFDTAGLPRVHKSSPLTSDGSSVRSRRGAAGGSDFKKAMGFTRDEDSKGGDESDTVTENESDWEDEAEGNSQTPRLADQARARQERKERRKAERRQKDARTTTTTALAPAKKASKTLAEVLNKKYEEVSRANQSEDVPGGTAERSLTRKRGVALPPVPTPSWVLQSVDGENAMAERGYFRAYAHIHQNMQWQMRELGHEKVWPPFPTPTKDPRRVQEGLRQMRQGNHEKAGGILADGSGLKDLEMETLRRSVAWDPDRALETIRQIERRDGPGSAWIETSPAGTRLVVSAAGQRHDG
ncbi:hypothetical protein KC360_g5772 [Hortaea werneckii]|nr:hypothetical protein KC325_g5496 [Hortaea werneckii]KAI6991913.1 hypothetical protein KC359_g5980 [Hortaea werneckii]KAI7144704.1 hypothetical protein KC344_g5132 [Hortaea werneckii]KAI7172040.1 hypothetical protein KC360_g5772 [Hortaea werneckii]